MIIIVITIINSSTKNLMQGNSSRTIIPFLSQPSMFKLFKCPPVLGGWSSIHFDWNSCISPRYKIYKDSHVMYVPQPTFRLMFHISELYPMI